MRRAAEQHVRSLVFHPWTDPKLQDFFAQQEIFTSCGLWHPCLSFYSSSPTGDPYKYNTRNTTINREEDISETPRVRHIETDFWPSIAKVLNKLPMGGADSRGWNCQSWVIEAISALRGEGHLGEDEEGLTRVQMMYQRKWKDYEAYAEKDESGW